MKTILFYLGVGFEAWLISNLLLFKLWLKQNWVQNKKTPGKACFPYFFQKCDEMSTRAWSVGRKNPTNNEMRNYFHKHLWLFLQTTVQSTHCLKQHVEQEQLYFEWKLLRSEIPSGMCAKLRTVAASNNGDQPSWWLGTGTSLHMQGKNTNWLRKPNDIPRMLLVFRLRLSVVILTLWTCAGTEFMGGRGDMSPQLLDRGT